MIVTDLLNQTLDNIQAQGTDISYGAVTVSGVILRSINRGNREILAIPGAYWNRSIGTAISTVIGTDQYSVSATLRNIINVRDQTNLTYLAYISYEKFVSLYPAVNTATDRGKPRYFYPIGISADSLLEPVFKVYPVPDGVYTLNVDGNRRQTFEMITTDTPVFPEEYHHILADYATWNFFANDLNPIYDEYKQRWMSGFLNLKREAMEEEAEGIPSMLSKPRRVVSSGQALDPTYWPGSGLI